MKIVTSRKVTGIIYRYNEGSVEILTLKFKNSNYPFYRLPGGGVNENEQLIDAVKREILEETGLANLNFLREIGKVFYFKPNNYKDVERTDFLFYANAQTRDVWEHVVTGNDKDKNDLYQLRWLKLSDVALVDPELSQFINSYNIPELFIEATAFGLANDEIRISEYNEKWQQLYNLEVYNIIKSIGPNDYVFNHIGSTAVEGMKAKPIIDILMQINQYDEFKEKIKILEGIGYTYKAENGINKRHYFTKGNPCFYHLHVMEKASAEANGWLKFRDTLRNNKEAFDSYAKVKSEAIENGLNRKMYQEYKEAVIRRWMK